MSVSVYVCVGVGGCEFSLSSTIGLAALQKASICLLPNGKDFLNQAAFFMPSFQKTESSSQLSGANLSDGQYCCLWSRIAERQGCRSCRRYQLWHTSPRCAQSLRWLTQALQVLLVLKAEAGFSESVCVFKPSPGTLRWCSWDKAGKTL